MKTSSEINQKTTINIFKNRWGNLIFVILDPSVIILLVICIVLFFVSKNQTNTTMLFILTLAMSLFTGILGSVFTKRYDDIFETKIIHSKGQSATRNLQFILNSSIDLEKRIGEYLKRFSDDESTKKISKEVVRTYLEEAIRNCVSIEENIVNSLLDWKDIVPEADIQEIINSITKYKEQIINQEKMLAKIAKELQDEKNQSVKEKIQLKKDKENLEKLIFNNRAQVYKESANSGINNISGSLVTGGTIFANPSFDTSNKPFSFDGIIGKNILEFKTFDLLKDDTKKVDTKKEDSKKDDLKRK